MTHNDTLGQELNRDDAVLIVNGKYARFYPGIVVNFTAKKVRIMIPNVWIGTPELTLVDPTQCVLVDPALAQGTKWNELRLALIEAGV